MKKCGVMRLFSKLLTKFFLAAFCGFFLILSCSTSKKIIKPIQVSLAPIYLAPAFQAKDLFGNAYIDQIKLAMKDKLVGLEITGNLPDGCSRVLIKEDLTSLSIRSWKNRNEPCTMALEPFNVFYELKNPALLKSIQKSDSVLVNSEMMFVWKK